MVSASNTTVNQPSITITKPTPPRPTPTTINHRLLYRGSLSLPDSHLLLDGLTFIGDAGKSSSLLQNPLALALESMRGRPTLRFLGTMRLDEAWVDYSGGVCLCVVFFNLLYTRSLDAVIDKGTYTQRRHYLESISRTYSVRPLFLQQMGRQTLEYALR
jgi:hypothetical protein